MKVPAADGTDARQPWGLLWNPMTKMMINFASFFRVMKHQWNETDREKPKYSGGKNLSQCHFVHYNKIYY
jgi:hypothetical protein